MNINFRAIQKPAQEPTFGHERLYETPYTGTKYAEAVVLASKSVVQNQEGSAVDAGLALGRSFRVGWGPSGQLVHLGNLCGPGTKKWVEITCQCNFDSDLAIQRFSSP
jgi:hypothetical protein